MKKAMKQLFQKGISGILCAAMILTSLSIPEMTTYAAETGITEETENADVTNEEGTEAEMTDEGSDKEDANFRKIDSGQQTSGLHLSIRPCLCCQRSQAPLYRYHQGH